MDEQVGRNVPACSQNRGWRAELEPGSIYLVLLQAAVRSLPKEQQKAVRLLYWEGMSRRKAAKALGMSRGGLKRVLSKILDTLHGELSENPFVEFKLRELGIDEYESSKEDER